MSIDEETIEVWERLGRRRSSDGGARLTFMAKGSDDDEAILDAIAAYAPAEIFDNLLRNGEPDLEEVGYKLWEAVYAYGAAEEEITGADGPEFSFETGGGTIRVKRSLETIAKYKRTGDTQPIPDWKGAINIVGNRVEGIDIPAGQMMFAETHSPPIGFVTNAYKAACADLHGCMNTSTFRGWARGEVLYLGASGRARGQNWHISHLFARSPNLTIPASGDLPEVEKLGWDYMDVIYYDHADVDAGIIIQRPLYVKIERVHRFGDFSVLGIGT